MPTKKTSMIGEPVSTYEVEVTCMDIAVFFKFGTNKRGAKKFYNLVNEAVNVTSLRFIHRTDEAIRYRYPLKRNGN